MSRKGSNASSCNSNVKNYIHDDPHEAIHASSSSRNNHHNESKANHQQHDNDDPDVCLHCCNISKEVQVRCDECSSYICSSCHWCHEFQANHEIRVCDRCDAFYCRGCDEMDQCEDCGEVVCASCSTLLSCKFCGGGLCEDCATACGRCGIVLCSRDAKFAVDCDTCRLSYCLVCLASGNKDPCVRCNHRPSKRMEQLVHLRLKSIYKAFKQSSASSAVAASLQKKDLFPDEASTDDTDTEALMMAAAAASALSPPSKQTAKKISKRSTTAVSEKKDTVEEYKVQMEKADAAAAALLAELDEEEQAVQTRKNKKKKKKERQQAKRGEEKKQEDSSSRPPSPDEVRKIGGSRTTASAASSASNGVSNGRRSSSSSETHEEHMLIIPAVGDEEVREGDPLEAEYEQLNEVEDLEGLEELLASVKGVPGKALLRKNIKKAIKRYRAPPYQGAGQGDPVPAPSTDNADFAPVSERMTSPSHEGRAGAETPVQSEGDARVAELLRVVSHTHTKTPTGGQRTKPSNGKGNSECVMHMAPMIVGWVIGKGGQRIRDLMEESSARIWIDQDSMKPHEPRIVYVSGSRRNVDSAVRMIKDLIARAPTETPQSRQSTPATETSPTKGQHSMATTGKGIGLPKDFPIGGEPFHLKPRDSSGFGSPKTKHEMTCDPRFVPLLIGRRGWTIKNIQDASGARIDIDQTVTPRRITIFGSTNSVEIAKGMVGDVLSYPQSQLHGATDEDGNEVPFHATEHAVTTKEKETPAQPVVEPVTVPIMEMTPPPIVPMPPQETEGLSPAPPSPPPPASMIMAGDGKDAISASSSLSSTPEPTIAVKAMAQLAPSGPLLPPTAHHAGMYPPPSNGIAGFTETPGPVADNPFASEAGLSHVETLMGGPSPLSRSPRASLEDQGIGGTPNPYPPPSPFGNSAFQATRQAPSPSIASPLVNRPIANLSPEVGGMLAGIWNSPTNRSGPSGEFGFAAAVDFLQHNQPQGQVDLPRREPVVGGLAPPARVGAFPPPYPSLPPQGSQGGTFGSNAVKDESHIVDSLFGPSESSNDHAALINGLDELGLGTSVEGPSIWGNGTTKEEEVESMPGLGGLLSETQQSVITDSNLSRFMWGSSA